MVTPPGRPTDVSGRTRVILDCDTENEIDDQLAIAYALGSPDLDVLGVVSVHDTIASGPDSVDRYVEEAQRITTLCGRDDVPCLAGARGPMATPDEPVGSEGLDFIVEQLRDAPVTLVATGPITDVASLVVAHPELMDRVDVVWAGAFGDEATWERYKLAELNARADIAAWRALYGSPIELTLLPGWPEIANVAVRWRDYVDRLSGLGSPLGHYLATIIERWCLVREDSGLVLAGGSAERKVLWDVVNVAYLRDPRLLTIVDRDLPTLDAAGAPDYRTPARTARVCVGVDHVAILADLWSVLASIP